MKKIFLVLFFLSLALNLKAQSDSKLDEELFWVEKNPAMAFACSMIVPGLGQMYNEQVGKGFIFITSSIIGFTAYNYGEDNNKKDVAKIGLAMIGVSYLISLIDAPIIAQNITDKVRKNKFKQLNHSEIQTNSPDIDFKISPYFDDKSVGFQVRVGF